MTITVLGAGVVGLSSGVALLEAGYPVTLIARDFPPHTTSNLAAALWYPFIVEPRHKVQGWSASSYRHFSELLDTPEAGVSLVEMLIFSPERPWWLASMPPDTVRPTSPTDDLPPGYTQGDWVNIPLAESQLYLPYLLNRFRALGGVTVQRHLSHLNDLPPSQAVINCTGLGAGELLDDPELYPVAGHAIPARLNRPGRYRFDERLDDKNVVAYIIPRRDICILGGSEGFGADDTLHDDIVQRILERCYQLDPSLREATLLPPYVGLRPGRTEVRLERTQLPDGTPLIHNYGHGGGGFTLAWGCALEVVGLVEM